MPKAYAVVTYRSISDPEKLAAYAIVHTAMPNCTRDEGGPFEVGN